ncbi:MAG: DeoR/GlpR family DNA-binding transcription regulator [Treponema sp.]|jgi:DeoR/GlpR family transcriptional regulator of sugar metabolism|nr:DeoR/GlpR family DNA-binding transcription regulator [Treponema sp.]
MKKTEDRKDQLIEYLKQRGKLSVSEIAEFYGVSLPTARRMCAQLEKEQRAMRTHGGIRFVPDIKTTYAFETIDAEYNTEKEAIARSASALVKNKQTIFLESGTTVKHFAVALAERIRDGQLADISVFTNSLVNLDILESVCSVMVVGGYYRHERRDFCGFLCEKMLRTLRFNACFIGADAVNLNDGIMAMDAETVRLDELLIERSDQAFILAHSEKFRKHSLISYCAVQDVSTIITDSKLPDEILREYQAAGVKVICA